MQPELAAHIAKYSSIFQCFFLHSIEKLSNEELNAIEVSETRVKEWIQVFSSVTDEKIKRRIVEVFFRNGNLWARRKFFENASKELKNLSDFVFCYTENATPPSSVQVLQLNFRPFAKSLPFAAIATLNHLQVLDLGYNSASIGNDAFRDITEGCQKLERLDVDIYRCKIYYDSPLNDISPVRNCPSLVELNLSELSIRSIEPIAACAQLRSLRLDGCKRLQAEAFLAISRLSHLMNLSLRETAIDDVPLIVITDCCQKMKKLELDMCFRIKKPGFLSLHKLASLENLSVNGTTFDDEALQKVATDCCLKILRAYKCKQLRDASPLASCRFLIELELSCTSVDDQSLQALQTSRLPLQSLSLDKCEQLGKRSFKDLFGEKGFAALAGFSQLKDLSLQSTRVKNLRSFTPSLKQLTSICLANCSQLKDVSPLAECPKLSSVSLTFKDQNRLKASIEKLKRTSPQIQIVTLMISEEEESGDPADLIER